MDYTNIIYSEEKLLKEFQDKYPNCSIKVRADVEVLLWLNDQLNLYNGVNADEDFKNILIEKIDKNSKYSSLYQDILNGLEEHNNEFKFIKKSLAAIKKYGENTILYLDNGYSVTLPELAELLDLDIDYVNENIKEHLDYFKINNTARYVIKSFYPDRYAPLFINKHIFISRDSIKRFLLKHLKYSSHMVQIDLTFDPIRLFNINEKLFKGKKIKENDNKKNTYNDMYRVALNKLVKELNVSEQILKKMKEEFEENNPGEKAKISRHDLPLHSVNEEMVSQIMGGDIVLKSTKSIKLEAINDIKIELQSPKFAGYPFKAFADTQLYNYLDYKTTSTRFKIAGITKERMITVDVFDDEEMTTKKEKQLKKEEKMMIKYSFDCSQIVKAHLIKDNYYYSLDAEVYKKLTKGANNKEEEREKILQYFYTKLMDPEFEVYSKKNN